MGCVLLPWQALVRLLESQAAVWFMASLHSLEQAELTALSLLSLTKPGLTSLGLLLS